MEIIKKRIADMERAEYNPRVELMPGDDEYEKLKRNIDRFGVVVPVIWNKRTNRVVSGHQRLTVLMNEGVTETDVSVVDLDETAEKQLNIAMNKVTGEWDEVKLKELLDGLGVWDYSGMPLNYKGQICLPFSILWIFVSIAAVVLDDWLRYWLFGEERPHYTLFRRGESR